jgi:hypothetical protein
MTLRNLDGMEQLNVFAPALTLLNVADCFGHNQPVANICAPQMTSLNWNEAYDPSSTLFGNIRNLKWLGTHNFLVYGQHDYLHELWNSYCLLLIQRFQRIRNLRFMLIYWPVSSVLYE